MHGGGRRLRSVGAAVKEAFASLEARVRRLEERMDSHGPTLLEHEERLTDHDRQLADIREVQRETSRLLTTLHAQVGRLSDAATTQGIGLERIERQTRRLLEILEPRTVVVEDGNG